MTKKSNELPSPHTVTWTFEDGTTYTMPWEKAMHTEREQLETLLESGTDRAGAIKERLDRIAIAQAVKCLTDAVNRGFTMEDVLGHLASAVLTKSSQNALNKRHKGARERRDAIQKVWKSGKYSSRDICAEEEFAALGFGSYSAARKALRNTPNPT